MPNRYKFPFIPGDPTPSRSVRGAYLQNLVNCVHICMLRGLNAQARRAWAILVRCPDIDWKERWYRGLYLLTDGADKSQVTQSQSQYSTQRQRDDAVDYLNKLRLRVKPDQKPEVLAELVLHLIHTGRYTQALEQLELFLVDHPYDKSAALHSYAGMVCFWLALPESMRDDGRTEPRQDRRSDDEGSSPVRGRSMSLSVDRDEPPDESMLQKARRHFDRALDVDPDHTVAREFINMIDNPSSIATGGVPSMTRSTSLSDFTPSPRPRSLSIDMLSVASSPRTPDLASEVESLRTSSGTPRPLRRSSPEAGQAPSRSFGAMSLDAVPTPEDSFGAMSLDSEADFPDEMSSDRGSGFRWPRLGELQDGEEAGGLSRNASLADLADVRSEGGSDVSLDSMDSFGSGASATTDTVERISGSSGSQNSLSA